MNDSKNTLESTDPWFATVAQTEAVAMADEEPEAASGEAALLDASVPRVPLMVEPGRAPWLVDKAEDVLVPNAERLRIFQRANELVRIVEMEQTIVSNGLRREAGSILLSPMTRDSLAETFERLIQWLKMGKNGPREIDCPDRVCRRYLSRVGEWKIPHLTGIISAPTMRADGSVLHSKGYDPQTGLYLTADWDAPPAHPTKDDARRAVETLLEPFAEFPFVSDTDKAVFLCAILTALQRRLLPSAPLLGFTAPTPRTGKSLLAESVALIASGHVAAAMTVSPNAEEIRKAVASALREGHLIVNLDNIEGVLASPDLSRAITQIEYADRVLGESRILHLPTNVLWTATGNNLTFEGDLAVRVVLCRLDAQLERPENRSFRIRNLKAHIAQNRRRLVQAALTILSAYHADGSPAQDIPEYGGFEEWSRQVRSSIVWAGCADACLSREEVLANDPGRDAAETLLQAWYTAVDDTPVPLKRLVRAVATSKPDLRDALLLVAGENVRGTSIINPAKAGHWCRAWLGRVVNGYRLQTAGKGRDGQKWYVQRMSKSENTKSFDFSTSDDG